MLTLYNSLEYILFTLFEKNKNLTIYSHNLGSFDGYFIYRPLVKYFKELYYDKSNPIDALIDDRNKFITITAKYLYNSLSGYSEEQLADLGYSENDKLKKSRDIAKWKFLDSYRLFSMSLNELTKMFGVQGKSCEYKQIWNTLDFFDDPVEFEIFKEYSLQDSEALLKAMIEARKIYYNNHNIDITNTLSTSSLALKIFRHQFMERNQDSWIPLLERWQDKLFREAYLGGATSAYKFKYDFNETNQELRYIDVNSLYPFAMLNPMPLKYRYTIEGGSLKDVFGFVEAYVTTPKDIKVPVLIYRNEAGELLHPRGEFKGIWFSEELKAAEKYGYKIQVIKSHIFTKKNLFNKYVDFFYNLKKDAADTVVRKISKMMLNSVYGMFGRKLNMLKTIICNSSDALDVWTKYPIKSITKLDDNKLMFLVHDNLNFDNINKLNSSLNLKLLEHVPQRVQANVAIAAAITSYARIHMMTIKTLPDVEICYTDTDSFFITGNIPEHLLSDTDIGLFKDELKYIDNGVVRTHKIVKAYFFDKKFYAYLLDNGKHKTIVSGVPKNSLSWEQIEALAKGEILELDLNTHFYKSLTNLLN